MLGNKKKSNLYSKAEIYTIQRFETAIEHRYLTPL